MRKPRPKSKPKFTKKNLPDWFCPVPFATLIFNPWGNVGSCREQGNQLSMGDVREQDWREIWNGKRLRAWRREFLTGKIKTCAEHIRHRRCNKAPMNQELIPFIELDEVQSTPPKRVSPDFNGHCNLRCEMCSVWKEPNGLYDKLGFWEDAEKNIFPYLKQMDPLAGEPFLQKDTFRLMDIMGRVNPACEWRITTNAHWKFTPFIREKLDKITLRDLNISLDSIDEKTYARIRERGRLKTALETVDQILRYRDERGKSGRSFNVILNTTVQKHNWREIPDFIRFVIGKQATPGIQFLYDPRPLSLLSLKESERIEILNEYFRTMEPEYLQYCRRLLVPLYDSLPAKKARKYSTLMAQISEQT